MSLLKHLSTFLSYRHTKLLLTLALLALLVSWIDIGEFYHTILSANYGYLGAAAVLILLNRLLMPIKWGVLLRGIHIRPSWWLIVKSYFIAGFLGIFLPPTVGADAVRAYYINKRAYELPEVIASIVVERAIGFAILLLFAVLGCLLFTQHLDVLEFELQSLLLISLALLTVLIAGLVLSLNKQVANYITGILQRPRASSFFTKICQKLETLFVAYVKFSDAKMHLIAFALLTCIETMLPIIRSYIVGLALGVTVPLSYYFAFQPLVILLTRLPISIDGFGINEGMFAYFLGLMGVSLTLGFSIGLVNHILFLMVISLGGLMYAFDKQPTATPKPYGGQMD